MTTKTTKIALVLNNRRPTDGRSRTASEARHLYVTQAAEDLGLPMNDMIVTKQWSKPRFEVIQERLPSDMYGTRAWEVSLIERDGSGRKTVLDTVHMGLYGGRLDTPTTQDPQPATQEVEDPTIAQMMEEYMAENPDADYAMAEAELIAMLEEA